MEQVLVRQFEIEASQAAFLAVASRPLLAPEYLNFLTKIETVTLVPTTKETKAWEAFRVWVNYRGLLQTTAVISCRLDATAKTMFLRHDGPFATFEAQFQIGVGLVRLECAYKAKVRLITWLIATMLDRALNNISSAMDRYAAAFESPPT
jgi:ribosome-associated toxin RatA of RatAB toxin-antitoxin module